MPQVYDTGPGGSSGQKKNKRKNVIGPPPPTPQPAPYPNITAATGGGGNDYYTKIGAAEDGGAGTLPTSLIKAIVGTQPREDDIWRTASLLAQHWDISPQFFLGDKTDYTFGEMLDPQTGKPLTFSQARNFFKVYEPMYLYQLLKQYQAPIAAATETYRTPGHVYNLTLPGRGEVDGQRVADAFKALSPVNGDELPFKQALAIAIAHAQDEKFDEALFKANLKVTLKSQALFPDAKMTTLQAIALAEELAHRGITASSPKDIAYALDPMLAAGGGTLDAVNASLEREFPGILARAKANPESEDAIFLRQQQGMALNTMGFSPESVGIFQGMLDAIGNRETNYITAGEHIAEQYQASKDSMSLMNSWVGRNLIGKPFNFFMDIYDRTVGVVERVGLDPGVWGMDPTGRPLWVPGDWGLGASHRVAGITGAPEIGQAEAWRNAMQDIHDIVFNDADFYSQLERQGMPPLSIMLADLVIGFKIGPDILALKAWTKATREGRLLASTERLTKYADHIAPDLLRALEAESDPEKFYLRVVNSQVGYYTKGLDPQLMAQVYHVGKNLLSAGRSSAEVLDALKSMLIYGGGSMAHDAFSTVMRGIEDSLNTQRAEKAAELAGAWGFTPEERMTAAAGRLPDEARWALGALDDMDMARLDTLPGGLIPEVPHTSWTRSLGIWDSGKWRDSGLGRAINAATAATSQHTNIFRLNLEHPNLVEDAGNLLVRSRVFSEQERAQRILELSRFRDPRFIGRETGFANWVTDTNNEIISRISAAYGLDPEQAKTVEEAMQQAGITKGRVPTYGILSGYAVDPVTGGKLTEAAQNIPISEPYLTSQLLNYGTIIDPVALRSGIAEATGYYRQVKALIQRTLGMDVTGGALHLKGLGTTKKVLDGVWTALVQDLFLSIWKPLAVMRPAYILRVVGIEEQLRFFSTLGLQERLEAGRVGGYIADRLPGRSLSVVVEHDGKTAEELADAFGYTRRNSMLTAGEHGGEVFVPARVSILDGVYAQVDLPLPSPGQLTRRGYAESASRQFQLTGAERSGYLDEVLNLETPRDGAHFEPIAQDAGSRFYQEWERYLKFQVKNDPIGNLHLQAISQGMDPEQAVTWVTDKLMSSEYHDFAARLMGKKKFSREALEEQVRVGQNAIRNAAVDQQVATDLLDGLVSQPYLRAHPHPPELISGAQSEAYLGRRGPFHRARDRWGDLILRMPTNALSRHPYAAAWETRMREAMTEIAAERGPLTLAQTDRITAAAEKFARLQVQRIMFDYTRTTRFAEATAFMFPFFQPYAEAFLVWGRILRQNPTVVGYVSHILHAGAESGVLEKDYTGALRVPMTNWLANGPLLDVLFSAPGFHTSAQLNAFNLFWQSAINVPLPGVGDVPIPVPALNPEALFVLQRYLYADESFLGIPGGGKLPPELRSRLLTWATQYGDVTPASIFPSYLRNFAAAVAPEWFADQTNLQADNMLRLMSYKGITAERLAADPEFAKQTAGRTFEDLKDANAWLAAQAQKQGRILSLWRGLMGMFSPAALTVSFPYQGWQDELTALREQYPNDYRKVEETFLARHLDGWQFLQGNTVWNPQGSSPLPLPANEAVTRFFMGKGAKEFANTFPEFAFFIIPHEIRDSYDFGSLWSQVGAGWRSIQSPQDKLESEAVDRGWSSYFDYREAFDAWQQEHPDPDPTALDAARNAILDGPVSTLRAANPIWAAAYDSYTNTTGIDPKVWGHVKTLIKDKLFTQTDLGKALQVFVPLVEDLTTQMAKHNIHNIDTKAAEDFGLAQQWKDGLAKVEGIGGEDWTRAYGVFFDHALNGVQTNWDRFTAKLSPDALDRIYADFEQMRSLDRRIDNVTDRFDKYALYQQKRELVNKYYTEYGSSMRNPMVLDWQSKDSLEKLDYRNYIATLPYAWLTQFDRRVVLGDKSNAGAEKAWEWYNDRRNEISYKEAHDPAFGSGDAYDRLDKEMARKAKGNAALAAQIAHSNTWGYAFFQANPSLLQEDNPGNEKWQKLYDFVEGVRKLVDHYNATHTSEIHGTSDLNPDNKVWWNQVSEAIQVWVNDDLKENAHFRAQWNYYADLMGDQETLFEVFFPQSYYRIG